MRIVIGMQCAFCYSSINVTSSHLEVGPDDGEDLSLNVKPHRCSAKRLGEINASQNNDADKFTDEEIAYLTGAGLKPSPRIRKW